jgi:hypothetical protein
MERYIIIGQTVKRKERISPSHPYDPVTEAVEVSGRTSETRCIEVNGAGVSVGQQSDEEADYVE